MTARPKAEIIAERTAARRASGLVRATVWVPPGERDRLGRYVRGRLGGEYTPKGSSMDPPRDPPAPRRGRRPEKQHKLL